MPTDTVVPDWSAADIVGEALPALSFLCYARYDLSLELAFTLAGTDRNISQPVSIPEAIPPRKTKKTYPKEKKKYKLRKPKYKPKTRFA
jgi:hypothetical protein